MRMRPWNVVVESYQWPWLAQEQIDMKKNTYKKWNDNFFRAKKQTEWEKVDHCHAQGGGLLSNEWLENKKDLITKWDVCDALVVSRPEKIVHKTIRLTSNLG